MAVVSVSYLTDWSSQEDWQNNHSGTIRVEVVTDSDVDNENTVRTAVDPFDTAKKVFQFGDAHPAHPNAPCIRRGFERNDDNPRIWYVDCEFDSEYDNEASTTPDAEGNPNSPQQGNQPGEFQENPLMRPAKWKYGTIDRQEVAREWIPVAPNGSVMFTEPVPWASGEEYRVGSYVKNGSNVYRATEAGLSGGGGGPTGAGSTITDGTVVWSFWSSYTQAKNDPRFALLVAITNSGNVPFDPQQMTDVSIPVLSVTKNVPVSLISAAYILRIKNAVNLTAWKGFPPRTAKVLKFDANNEQEKVNGQNVSYAIASWDIGLDPDTWDLRPLDCGFGRLEETRVPKPPPNPPAFVLQDKYIVFKDPTGEVYSSPVLMNGQGGMLEERGEAVFLRGIPRQMKLIDFNEDIFW